MPIRNPNILKLTRGTTSTYIIYSRKKARTHHISSITFAWWQQAQDSVSLATRRGLNTPIILGSWILWKARNVNVFNGVSPRVDRAILLTKEEVDLWMLSGAKGLIALVASYWLIALLETLVGHFVTDSGVYVI